MHTINLINGCKNNEYKAQVRVYELYKDILFNVSYRILNSAGQEVLNGAIKDRFTHLKINLSNGLYFIEIDHGNRTKRLKLLKQ